MKNNTLILFILQFSLFAFNSSAALQVKWDVDLAAQPPQVFTLQRPRGETYELEAILKRHGKPFEPAITNACIYWQTNGMENLYWSAPASVSNNFLRATWIPSMDPGATTVRGYIGDPGHLYAASFQLRFIASPGATPNELPLPQKVIDFAKVTVLNPPWSGGGGGGGVDTNAVRDIIHETVSGSARPLPPYLHYIEMDDTYPDAAAEWYAQADYSHGSCSSVRDGNTLSRNYDWTFDFMPEFVIRLSAGPAIEQSNNPNNRTIRHRFASLAVCNVGTNLTEADVTSGKWSKWYKALPGHAVDGINENGVACNINVVSGTPAWHTTGDLHPLAAVRWILDNATNAQHAAEYIAANIRFPAGWTQNFHFMIADSTSTYIVENGNAHPVPSRPSATGVAQPVLTNFQIYPTRGSGEGQERYDALASGANITSQWWTLTYTAAGYRASDLPGITGEALTQLFDYWENNPRESHRGESFGNQFWWQTVHTSIYDLTNRVLRVAVQETDDWYVFAVDQANVDLSPIKAQLAALQDGKRDYDDLSYNHGIGPGHGSFKVTQDVERHDVFVWNGYWQANGWVSRTSYFTVDGTITVHSSGWPSVVFHAGPEAESQAGHSFNALEGDEFDYSFIDPGGDEHNWHIKVDPYVPDSVDKLATESGVAAAVATKQDSLTPQQIANIADVQNKRTLTDNTCHKTEFTEWTPWNVPSGVVLSSQPQWDEDVWVWESNKGKFYGNYLTLEDSVNGEFWYQDGEEIYPNFTATRTAVCTDGKKFVTSDVVDGKVSSAVSTNNPAFVSAVRNTPTSEMPDDMPTDWGTYGTVGAALAALAAFVKWAKAKIVAVIGDDGKPTDNFATDLLGKPVAKTALMIPLESKTDSFAAEDGHAYAVTMTGTVTITMPTTTAGKAAIFQARFSAAAQQSVEFSTTALVKFDGTDCGIVKAGKDALLSAMWNGSAWDLVWKNEA